MTKTVRGAPKPHVVRIGKGLPKIGKKPPRKARTYPQFGMSSTSSSSSSSKPKPKPLMYPDKKPSFAGKYLGSNGMLSFEKAEPKHFTRNKMNRTPKPPPRPKELLMNEKTGKPLKIVNPKTGKRELRYKEYPIPSKEEREKDFITKRKGAGGSFHKKPVHLFPAAMQGVSDTMGSGETKSGLPYHVRQRDITSGYNTISTGGEQNAFFHRRMKSMGIPDKQYRAHKHLLVGLTEEDSTRKALESKGRRPNDVVDMLTTPEHEKSDKDRNKLQRLMKKDVSFRKQVAEDLIREGGQLQGSVRGSIAANDRKALEQTLRLPVGSLRKPEHNYAIPNNPAYVPKPIEKKGLPLPKLPPQFRPNRDPVEQHLFAPYPLQYAKSRTHESPYPKYEKMEKAAKHKRKYGHLDVKMQPLKKYKKGEKEEME